MRVAVLAALLLMTGCSNTMQDEGPFEVPFDSAVHLPLAAHTEDGSQYRFKHVTFEIVGAAMLTLSERDAQRVDAETVVTSLPQGDYHVYIRPGFEVVRLHADGSETPTHASLASSNPLVFQVGRTADARLSLALELEGQQVVFGVAGGSRVTSAQSALDEL